jgi:endoglucanase
VLFSKHCPLLEGKLSMGMRMLYTSVTWCYISNTIAVPLSVFVPFIALVFGIYPLVLNRDFALASLLYFVSQTMVTSFCIDLRHLKPLWYCQVSCHLLWFTFTKALLNILLAKARIKKKVVFKSTKKKGENGEEEEATSCCVPRLAGDLEGTKDYWVLVTSFSVSLTTCIAGIYQIIDGPFTEQGDFRWYLLLSIFWAIYNMVPPSLFLFYCMKRGRTFEEFCSFCFVLAFLVAFGGLACAWLVPPDYNTGQVLGLSLQFFQAQQSGKLPKNFPVPWRQSANLWDSVILPNGRNYSLVGGWFDQGDGLKVSYTIATSVALLSWSFTEMRYGFASSGNDDSMASSIRWGAEYLMKCHVTNQTGMSDIFIGQVGDVKLDHAYWGRPESMAMQRPAYAVDAKRPASDLMGSAAAALAAASVALKQDSAQSSVLYLNRAELLYRIATRNRGLYNRFVPTSSVYPSSTFYDDLAWAAAWLYRATENEAYLADAETFWATSVQTETHVNPNPYIWNYENILPGVHLLLEDFTGNSIYSDYANDFVSSWIRGVEGGIYYTPKGLAKGDPAGTLQHTANAALFVMLYSGRRGSNRFMALNCWARTQIGYMLGDGGRSFVVGYGELSPKKVPHRGASCTDPTQGECTWETAYYSTDTNPNILYGALVGGPDDQDVWFDDRDVNSVANSIGLLNNAGFTSALAGLHGRGINMAKCEQGNGVIQNIILKAKKMTNMPGQRWWEGI